MAFSGDDRVAGPSLEGAQGPRGRFTDIHCHCLPGLDDGPANMAESIDLCRALVYDGVSRVVATPHQLGRFDGCYDGRIVREAVDRLNRELSQEGIALDVLPGADVRIDERIPQMLESGQVLTVADAGRYLLLELPHGVFLDPQVLLARLNRIGVTVVVTHPERHGFLAAHPSYVNRWLEDRPCLQITAGSFLGEFGRAAQQAARAFLQMDLPVLVATDAHDVRNRPPRMTAAHRWLAKRLGSAAADLLCAENPRRAVAGAELVRLGHVVGRDAS